MTMFAKLKEYVSGILQSRKKMNAYFTKKDLKQYVAYLKSQHISIVATLEGPFKAISKKLADEMDNKKASLPVYSEFRKYLAPELRARDAKIPFSMLIETNKKFIDTLTDIESDIDANFQLNKISMLNLRFSHIILNGILKQSADLSKYTKYMFSYLSCQLTGLDSIPKYRAEFIAGASQDVADVCNQVAKDKGAVSYRKQLDELKKNASDHNLLSMDVEQQIDKIESSVSLSNETTKLVNAGIFGLPTFQSIGEFINIIQREISKFLLQEEEWMKGHVAILQMQLSGISKDDPDYAKIEKIVLKYESMIDTIEKSRSKIG